MSLIFYFLELRGLFNKLSLPVHEGDREWQCMTASTEQPQPKPREVKQRLKPNLPFNMQLARLIENYMCRIHKALLDTTGKGLPLLKYMRDLQHIFRDKDTILPSGAAFCQKKLHAKKDLEC